VLDKYSDDVKIVFKHFPLGNHRFAATAALASVAAHEQGKFWQYHDLIFENMKELTNDKFAVFAKKIGLNMPLFTKAMNAKATKDIVIKDHSSGRDAGVTGTPAVFINGIKLRKRSFEGFQKLINAELKRVKE
jgi:protein-disulfide isomerase